MSMKIYTDDPMLPYKTTRLNALYTKAEIDGLFAKFGIKDVYWHYDPEHNDVYVIFKILELINNDNVELSAKVSAPTVWDHKTRKTVESVNWNISMRVLYWFLKSHLEEAYLRRSTKASAFLPFIINDRDGQTLEEVMIPKLAEISKKGLPEITSTEQNERIVINAKEGDQQ